MYRLIEALDRVLKALEPRVGHEVVRDQLTLSAAMQGITGAARPGEPVTFLQLFEGQRTRGVGGGHLPRPAGDGEAAAAPHSPGRWGEGDLGVRRIPARLEGGTPEVDEREVLLRSLASRQRPDRPCHSARPRSGRWPPPADAELEDVEAGGHRRAAGGARAVRPARAAQPAAVPRAGDGRVVECLLFVTDKPVTLDQLHEATGLERPRLRGGAGAARRHAREEAQGGTVLTEVAGGWQLRTDPDSGEYVRRFLRVKPHRLTRAALETLAIVAYRQPVTRPEIEDVRGVDSGAVLKALLERQAAQDPREEGRGRAGPSSTAPPASSWSSSPSRTSRRCRRCASSTSCPRSTGRSWTRQAPATPEGEAWCRAGRSRSSSRALDEAAPGAEEAMEALEQAMEEAEARSKAAAALARERRPRTAPAREETDSSERAPAEVPRPRRRGLAPARRGADHRRAGSA